MSRIQDLSGVLRGLQLVIQAGIKIQDSQLKQVWSNSSVKTAIEDISKTVGSKTTEINAEKIKEVEKLFTDGVGRVSTVFEGVKNFAEATSTSHVEEAVYIKEYHTEAKHQNLQPEHQQVQPSPAPSPNIINYKIELTPSDKALLKKLDMEHREKLKKQEEKLAQAKQSIKDSTQSKFAGPSKSEQEESYSSVFFEESKPKPVTKQMPSVKPNIKSRQQLNPAAKQRTVPSSRLGRMFSFGSLAAGLGIGTAAEYARRTLGIKEKNQPQTVDSMFLTPANTDRIVDTLCKVRGAALKIGQLLSIQDESIVSPQLAKALERVRKSADFMPDWQVDKVLVQELGPDWRANFEAFDVKPFAAASIGQVHWARLLDGREVAMKIQYPGVAKGIESDIDNLVGIMKIWNMFPDGMFIDNVVTVAKKELSWEVDYYREADCTRQFKNLLKPYPDYYVPEVIDSLCTQQIFTSELIEGIPVDQCVDMDYKTKQNIALKVLRLCLIELLELRYMQTDPNWANFFYNAESDKLILLDFGASREYSKEFMDVYIRIIKAAAENDRNTVLKLSRDIGFLTGYESKIMEQAHVDAVMILGEAFQHDSEFNFATQNTTQKIQSLVPTMLAHRLCPPPEEVYSIHRKVSGVFLLCSKLKVAINCRQPFLEMYNKYKFG